MNYTSQHARFCKSARFPGKQNCKNETKADLEPSKFCRRGGTCPVMATAQAANADRTVVVCGVPDGCLSDDVMADILVIHFQKSKNKGADVEKVIYPTSTRGVAYVTFEDKRAAENVLTKDEHSLEDRRLCRAYPLKVSLYGKSVSWMEKRGSKCHGDSTRSVLKGGGDEEVSQEQTVRRGKGEQIFTCVSCDLDLSTFGEKAILEDLVEDLKKNFTTLNFGPLQPNGQISVEGSFSAISTLQNKLLLKVKCALSEQHAQRKERAPDHRLNTNGLANTSLSLESSSDFVQHTPEEGLAVVTDTDIYSYMKKIKGKLYQRSLKQCGVTSHECVDGEVTTIYLDNDNTKPGPSLLKEAKKNVEGLLAELQDSLRKKRFSLDGFNKTEKRKCQQAFETVSTQFPHVLVIPSQSHVDIIGSSSDIYTFAQEMNKMLGTFQKKPWR